MLQPHLTTNKPTPLPQCLPPTHLVSSCTGGRPRLTATSMTPSTKWMPRLAAVLLQRESVSVLLCSSEWP